MGNLPHTPRHMCLSASTGLTGSLWNRGHQAQLRMGIMPNVGCQVTVCTMNIGSLLASPSLITILSILTFTLQLGVWARTFYGIWVGQEKRDKYTDTTNFPRNGWPRSTYGEDQSRLPLATCSEMPVTLLIFHTSLWGDIRGLLNLWGKLCIQRQRSNWTRKKQKWRKRKFQVPVINIFTELRQDALSMKQT